MITNIVLGVMIICAGLLAILFAESLNEARNVGVNFCRFDGLVILLIGLQGIFLGCNNL